MEYDYKSNGHFPTGVVHKVIPLEVVAITDLLTN